MPELTAREVFGDLPHWDDDATRDEQVLFKAGRAPVSATHEFLDDLSLADVIWDAEFAQHELQMAEAVFVERDVPVHHPEVASMTSLLSVGAVCSVFDERPQMDVLWDEELLDRLNSHEGLLQQLAGDGEFLHDAEQKIGTDEVFAMDLCSDNGKPNKIMKRDANDVLILVSSSSSLVPTIDITDQILDVHPNLDTEDIINRPEELYNKSRAGILAERESNMCASSMIRGFRSLGKVSQPVFVKMLAWRQSSFSPGRHDHEYELYCDLPDCSIIWFLAEKSHLSAYWLDFHGLRPPELVGAWLWDTLCCNSNERTIDSSNCLASMTIACAGQEMAYDHKNLVIFDGEKENGHTRYMTAEMTLWRRNASRPGNDDMKDMQLAVKADLAKLLSLAHYDISGHIICKLHHALDKCDLWHGQHDNCGCKEELAYRMSDRLVSLQCLQRLPEEDECGIDTGVPEQDVMLEIEQVHGIETTVALTEIILRLPYVISWHIMCQMLQNSAKQISNKAFKLAFLIGAYMICVNYKEAAIFVRKLWDPGIWRYIIRELVFECSMWLIVLLSRRWTPSHEPHKLSIKRFCIFISWPLMAFLRDGCALKILHWMAQGVCYLYIGLAWGQASFSGGGNVMTLMWPKRGPMRSSLLAKSTAQDKAQSQGYIKELCTSIESRQDIQNQKPKRNREERLPPQVIEILLFDFFCDCSRSRFDLAGVATGVTGSSAVPSALAETLQELEKEGNVDRHHPP